MGVFTMLNWLNSCLREKSKFGKWNMTKAIILGITLCSSLLLAEGSAGKLLQQKAQIKDSKSQNGLVQQKSIEIKDELKKKKSYPRGTILTH